MLLSVSVILDRSFFYCSFDHSRRCLCRSTTLYVFHTETHIQHERRLRSRFLTASAIIAHASATIISSGILQNVNFLFSLLAVFSLIFSHLTTLSPIRSILSLRLAIKSTSTLSPVCYPRQSRPYSRQSLSNRSIFRGYWRQSRRTWLVDRGRRCTTVPVHATPCMSADTAWTWRAVGRDGKPVEAISQHVPITSCLTAVTENKACFLCCGPDGLKLTADWVLWSVCQFRCFRCTLMTILFARY